MSATYKNFVRLGIAAALFGLVVWTVVAVLLVRAGLTLERAMVMAGLCALFLWLGMGSGFWAWRFVERAQTNARGDRTALTSSPVAGTEAERTEHQRIEAELRASEEKFRTLVETMPQGLVIFQDGSIVYANPVVVATGYSAQELQALTAEELFQLFVPQDRARVQQMVDALLSGQDAPQRLEARILDKAGVVNWVEVHCVRTIYRGRPAVQAIGVNITHHKALEQELWQTQQLFSNAFENAPIGMSLVTLDGRWVRANRALCELVGYSKEELLTKTFQEITHPDDLQADLEFVRQMLAGAITTYHMEKRYFHKAGHIVWVGLSVSLLRDAQGAPLYFISQIQDITERKRADEALRLEEARYRSLFDKMLDGFALHEIICDDAGKPIDYRFLEVNPAFAKMTGLTADRVVGKTAREVIPQLEVTWVETYGHVALTGEPTDFVQYSAPLNKYFHVSAFSPRTGQFATIFEDVTANMQAERAEHEQRVLAEALLDTSAALNSTLNIDAVLDRILDDVGRVLAHDAANIMLREGELLRIVRDRGYAERDPRGSLVGMTFQPDALHGIRQVIAAGESFVVHDTQVDPAWDVVPESNWIRSFLGVPILARGQVIGVLNLDSATSNFYRGKSLAGVEGFANQAGVAIYNAQLLQETQQRLRHIQALHAIDRAINASLDLQMTLDMLLGEALRVLEVDAADVLLLNRHAPILEFAAGRGFTTAVLRNLRVRVGVGYPGTSALEQRVVSVPDLESAFDGLEHAPQLRQENFVSYAAAPLISKGRVVGVLELYRRAHGNVTEDWRELLLALAAQAALAIENAHLFEDVNRANAELRLAYDATIEGWARALDLHDKEFDGHTKRVTALTLRLARVLGIAEEELVHWRRGALLHDIGKLGIPDTILRKPGPLDEHEQALLRRHPQLAYELLAPILYLRPALDIPYSHHEKWDGSGYPRGLKGKAIPLAARVFAVAHVWDALLSERPYRAAWSKERALTYLREEAGSHFDPEIVRVFFAHLDTLED